jgi:hypothetical protein
MLTHPDLMMAQMHYRQNELIAEAERSRLLAAARRGRRRAAATGPDSGIAPEVRGRPDGTLTACEPRVAAPAR